jgi:hypothetical protein
MSRIILLAGVAALAIAMPAAAEKGGKGGGHGNGGGHGQSAQVENHGGGHGDRGGGLGARHVEIDRHAAHARGHERREIVRQERAVRIRGRERFDDRRAAIDTRRRGFDDNERGGLRFRDDSPRFAGLGRGCPPGLAKKHKGCLPPGQARKLFGLGDRLDPAWFSGRALPAGYRDLYYDTPAYHYRYDDEGYIYRVDSRTNLISGLVPLLGGGFAVGQPMPAGYDVYNLPIQYRDTWRDSDEAYYRYGDNAIYQVDPQSGMIESIVALLTGDMSVGERLPTGYDAYNVPLDYRDRYYDNDDSLYRYADGNIYQVDAKTQIIQAIVEMLV